MGTRHLIAVVVDGEYKIAQYGQWDGYPDGQGLYVLNYLKTLDLAKLAEKARAASEVTVEQKKQLWLEVGHDLDKSDGRVDFPTADRFKQKWPHLDRDHGACILETIISAPSGLLIENNLSFAADGLFCEWAYVVDLDKRTFEVYKGFNQTPLKPTERFAYLDSAGAEYSPVKHLHTFSIDELPSKEEFLKTCEPEEEE